MASLEILSGLGAKGPACLRLRHNGRTILLDCGHGPEDDTPFRAEWLEGADLVMITHDHVDHIGGVEHVANAGLPVWCTSYLLDKVPERARHHAVPGRGSFEFEGITVTTGRNGHAFGGVWFHFDIGEGLLYTGDYSMESDFFAFDRPPPAGIVVADASYHVDNVQQAERKDALSTLVRELDGEVLFPVPPSGRAAELALFLDDLRPGSVRLDRTCKDVISSMIGRDTAGFVRTEARSRLECMVGNDFGSRPRFHLCDTPNADGGKAGDLVDRWRSECRFGHDAHIVFTGHMTAHARALSAAEGGHFRRWNVHPPLSDVERLANAAGARTVVPLFCAEPEEVADHGRFDGIVELQKEYEL